MRHMKAFRKRNSQEEFHQRFRSQSAMEYLMTYGWAILIIAVVLAALFELGVFNPMTFAPKASPGSCQVIRPEGAGTTNFISLEGECNGELPQYVASFKGQQSPIITVNSLTLTSTQFTVSVWASYNGNSAFNASGPNIFSASGGTGGGTQGGFQYGILGSGNIYCGLSTASGWYSYYTTTPFPAKKIINLVYEFNGTGINLYSNGQQFVSNIIGLTHITTSNVFAISGWTCGGTCQGESWSGLISNVQLYNTSLSDNEIQALYQEGIGGAPIDLQNLVGWWPLNGNANDYSGNGNNGVPTNVIYTSNWYSGYSTL